MLCVPKQLEGQVACSPLCAKEGCLAVAVSYCAGMVATEAASDVYESPGNVKLSDTLGPFQRTLHTPWGAMRGCFSCKAALDPLLVTLHHIS